MEEQRPALEAKGIRIAVITYDPRPALAHFAARRKISYALLADPESRVIRAFGILNETVKPDSPGFGVPYPGTFMVDPKGVVKSKYFEDDYRERHAAGSIVLREFNTPLGKGTVAKSPHLTVTTSATNATVFMGRRITLVADIELPKKMHVYAPGVNGYKPIEWLMNADKAAGAEPVRFPASRTRHLKAIGEKVPVYENRFRLTRDLSVGVGPEAREAAKRGVLEVEGTLRFQACDDKQCYLPESIPVKWTFQAQAPDSERVPAGMRGKVK